MNIQRLVLGIVFIFLLMGCGEEVVTSPTVTVTAVSPTITPVPPTEIPTNTPTSTSTATPIPTATAIPVTQVPTPAFLLPADAVDIFVQNVVLSSQGQLAYIRDGILYVESVPRINTFEEISKDVSVAAWSPDGSKLLYSTSVISNTNTSEPIEIHEQRLWSVAEKDDISLSELIPNYPNPAYAVSEVHWTPNGTKILLQSPTSDEELGEMDPTYFQNKLSVIDFESSIYTENQFATSNHRIIWLTDDVYVLHFHCGSPCAYITAHDYTGDLVWSPDWGDIGGFVAFATSNDFMINVGRINTGVETATLDKINLSTGDVDILWNTPIKDDYFTAFIMPSISLDEQYFSFNFGGGIGNDIGILYIVDEDGNEYGQNENSFLLDWRKNGDVMINKLLESGGNQLQLVSLEGTIREIFNTNPDVKITGDSYTPSGGGVWSPDGKNFVFIVENNSDKTAQIYIWNSDIDDPQLVHSIDNDKSFQSLKWLPDSSGVYFTSGKASPWREAIWFYDVMLNELKLIAPTN